jgi:hypothetical protein
MIRNLIVGVDLDPSVCVSGSISKGFIFSINRVGWSLSIRGSKVIKLKSRMGDD